MIITQLSGGLGNQMFQYAAGRRLAEIHNTQLKLDTSLLRNDPQRQFSLNCFRLVPEFATQEEKRLLTGDPGVGIGHYVFKIRRKFGICVPSYFAEPTIHFNPKVLELPNNIYMAGYWQSEMYFKDKESLIRDAFKWELSNIDSDDYESIISTNSISIHVRRGDYVLNKSTNKTHGVLPLDYYIKGVQYLTEKVGDPVFFVFTDDPEWAVNNLKIGCPFKVVSRRGQSDQVDMRLMTLCKHHVIANSSFSWWGAWLGAGPSSIIVAPQKWFNTLSLSTVGRFPASWVLIG